MSPTPSRHNPAHLGMTHQFDDRTIELLTTRAIEGLSIAEQTELRVLLHKAGIEDDISFDLAAASFELSCYSQDDVAPLPAEIAQSLSMVGQTWCQQARSSFSTVATQNARPSKSLPAFDRPRDTFNGSPSGAAPHTSGSSNPYSGSTVVSAPSRLPWVLAGVMSAVAIASIWRLSLVTATTGSVSNPSSRPSVIATDSQRDLPAELAKVRQVISQATDTDTLEWKDWDNPEIPGVKGNVIWSEKNQTGVIKFVGLKPNDPAKSQYQLWIIDSRGMNQRVSGAIFNVGPDGCVEVPIMPRIAIKNAAAFAITIEEPGGTWVSDMKRRVVIAAKG